MKWIKPATVLPRTGLYGESLGDGILAWECEAIAVGDVEDLAAERLTGAYLVASTLRQTDVPRTAWIASAAPWGGLRPLYAESALDFTMLSAMCSRATTTAPAWMTRYSRVCSSCAFSTFLRCCRSRGAVRLPRRYQGRSC